MFKEMKNTMAKRWLQVVAVKLVAKEWNDLSISLLKEYEDYRRDHMWQPPLKAQELLISGEDHRFFRHPGFDLFAICRAIYRRSLFGIVEGASTIDQQVVRVLSGRYERTLKRKFKEILLATLVTSIIPKRDLPGLYLRVGYFGWRMNNFKEACTRLKISPFNMSMLEAASIVARLKYPQPQVITARRATQINIRTRHLLNLHAIHNSTTVYTNLNLGETNAAI
ncbi:MAG: transglycosylase domain-containing protein [Nitrospirae bacterium]|nr:transglycosylase domain-containing protein [Nitrospirota bacterium]